MSEEEIITVNDARAAGYCLSGCKEWADRYGLDFRKFVREGLPLKDFPKDDAMVQHMMKVKRG